MQSQIYCWKPRTSGGTRTRNPRLRRPVPYPLGHGGNRTFLACTWTGQRPLCFDPRCQSFEKFGEMFGLLFVGTSMKAFHLILWKDFSSKNMLHCPGIEPGSQEWESCMIPLHQQCRRWPRVFISYTIYWCMIGSSLLMWTDGGRIELNFTSFMFIFPILPDVTFHGLKLASVEAHKNCTVGRISGRQCGVLGIVFN